MALSLHEIKEILKAPTNRAALQAAAAYEARISMHTEAFLSCSEVSGPAGAFLVWVRSILPADKAETFEQLLSYPLKTVPLVTEIYTELERVFAGRNDVEQAQFSDAAILADWQEYKQSSNLEEWREKAWQAVMTSINAVQVVDLPAEPAEGRPEPYSYFVDIAQVIDYKESENGGFEYIAFKQGRNRVAFYDTEYYRVLSVDDGGGFVSAETEAPHALGYCPAHWFWQDTLNSIRTLPKASPIAKQLGNLDWLLYFETSKKHLDNYAAYPIYSGYAEDCDYREGERECYEGILRDGDGNSTGMACPACGSKKLAGAGSYVEIPVPADGDADLRNPIQITTIDKDSLEYNVAEVERLKAEIFTGCTGSGGTQQRSEAVNETQVRADFDAKTSVLNSLKKNLEKAYKFRQDTVCRLRYSDFFLHSSYSFGTEFYIYSVAELRDQYAKAKEQGASETVLDALNAQILATEHKNDASTLQRMQTLRQLEPYRNKNTAELLELRNAGLLDDDKLKLKLDFNNLIERFERENGDILSFASASNQDKKINLINNQLLKYIADGNT